MQRRPAIDRLLRGISTDKVETVRDAWRVLIGEGASSAQLIQEKLNTWHGLTPHAGRRRGISVFCLRCWTRWTRPPLSKRSTGCAQADCIRSIGKRSN